MKLSQIKALQAISLNTDKEVDRIVLNPGADRIEKNNASGQYGVSDFKSAVTAWYDYARYGTYVNPVVGLHAKSELTGFFGENVATVGVNLSPEDNQLGVPTPTPEQAPFGYARLDIRYTEFFLSAFDTEEDEWGESEMSRRSRKHAILDGYLKGYGFDFRVPPFMRKWLNTIVEGVFITDDAKALQNRADRLNAFMQRKEVIRPAYLAGVEAEENGEPAPVVGSIMFRIRKTSDTVDLDTVPAGLHMLFDHRDNITYEQQWDPSVPALRVTWASLAQNDYAIELA